MSNRIREGPREKLLRQGVSSLTTVELLQVIIGSGNSYVSMSKIARKTFRLLSKYGSEVTYEQLKSVSGLGPARICQLLAVFEVASRYMPNISRRLLDTAEKSTAALQEVRTARQDIVAVVMLDGGLGHLSTRLFHINGRHPTDILRQIFVDILKDRADRVIIGIGSADREIQPKIFDLGLAKDLYAMARICKVSVKDFYILNKSEEMRLDGGQSQYDDVIFYVF